MTAQVRRALTWAALGLWLLSLALPVTLNSDLDWFGFHILVYGWLGLVLFQLAWFANLIFLVAIVLLGVDARSRTAALLIAVPLVLVSLEAAIPGMTPADLAGINWGNGPRDTSLVNGPGFYVWMLVMLGTPAALLGNVFMARPIAPVAEVAPS